MKIAYLGPKGTFSEEAACRYFAREETDWHISHSILDVLEAVREGTVDKGVVPIENSIEGTITMTVDGLLMYELFVEGEIVLPVSLNLLTASQTSLANIKEVWSIAPALAQCREFTRKLKLPTKHFDSTASAAKAVKHAGRNDVAAVASEWAAKAFDLHVLERNIQDNEVNHTRFVIVSKVQSTLANTHKTMLIVTPNEDNAGVLSKILNVFSALNINLSWIESRPTKKKLGTYQFFLEATVGTNDRSLDKAITILETLEHQVSILGSYQTTHL
ncbi:prephenate dehydratase [Scopulibacillus daqui]|uniref:Prephenate dehydratase n=1 Tax=Scopulibacillus daqui TaxID=1469162 RepID=A0ABS2Q2Q0_9BACL|nr:prephenate dehydratase [Scopulibacillus daqui]MBM7645979.1 prephenate dehydratase [Scopulibacillus daqui]